ncbi:DNA cytosine methyltransferase [Photobacterium leiognathi]|uniref:DNA cytosine methyltransferase n=1 Tax=Photobacterium leiognathi TaxID=553611 RepID=UPI0027392333|nr:DNA cytosine methyltransferase [Photobacterium leiognathi]
MKFLINSKIGMNKGVKRVWLEGVRLAKAGFKVGDSISVKSESDKVVVKRDDAANKIVSKRKKGDSYLPIIEITGSKLDGFNEGESIRVMISPKGIIITKGKLETTHNKMLDRLFDKIKHNKPLKTLSVFHGGGVLDRAIHTGLDSVGVKSKVAVAVELEAKYIESSISNNSMLFDDDSVIIESPVELLNLGCDDQFDVTIMGIPCTGASIAGRTKNKLANAESHDTAGSLFHYALMAAVKSPIVIIENVVPYMNTVSYSVIESVLKAQGYSIQTTVLNGNDFGAIENRDRMCAIAVLNEIADKFDVSKIISNQEPPMIAEILEDVPDDSKRWKTFQYLIDKEIRDKEAGKGFARNLVDGTERKCGTIGRLYHKCRSTETYVKATFDDVKTRLFTPIEHARVKTIPEDLVAGQCDTTAHEILGQSVIFNCFKKGW